MPLTVGPGSISVAVTLGANTAHHYGFHVILVITGLLAIALIGASIYLCYAFADGFAGILGNTGMTIIVRISAFLLVCIGVQITWNGVSSLLSSLVFRVR